MRSMAIERRRLLALAAAALLPLPARAADPWLVSAAAAGNDDFVLAAVETDGALRWQADLPARGHGMARRPGSGELVAMGRRPGRFASILAPDTGRILATLTPAEARSFAGHAAFTPDGRFLLTSEEEAVEERGLVGVRDGNAGWRQVGELSSGGVGPHDLSLLPGGAALVVANGGITTSVETGRAVLTDGELDSAVTVLDAASGAELHVTRLDGELSSLSLRHLAVDRRGRIAFAAQNQGSADYDGPLVGLILPDGVLHWLEAPAGLGWRLRGYVGSVAFAADGGVVVATSPRGGRAVLWRSDDGALLGEVELADVCGVATCGGEVVLSSGAGALRSMAGRDLAGPALHWDNHLLAPSG
jgi:hypothetical protein